MSGRCVSLSEEQSARMRDLDSLGKESQVKGQDGGAYVLTDLDGAPYICPGSKAPLKRISEGQRNKEKGEGEREGEARIGSNAISPEPLVSWDWWLR